MKRSIGMIAANACDIMFKRNRILKNMILSEDLEQYIDEYAYCQRIIRRKLDIITSAVNVVLEDKYKTPVKSLNINLGETTAELIYWMDEIDNATDRLMRNAIEYITQVKTYSNRYAFTIYWPGEISSSRQTYIKKYMNDEIADSDLEFEVEIKTKDICKITWTYSCGSHYKIITSPEKWQTFWNKFITQQSLKTPEHIQALLIDHLPDILCATIASYLKIYSILDMLKCLHNYLAPCSLLFATDTMYIQQQNLMNAIVDTI